MRKLWVMDLIDQPIGDGGVTVDAAIAQKRPVAANIFKRVNVYLAQQNLFFVVRTFCDDSSERIAQERSAPKFQACPRSRFATNVSSFKTYAIYHCHIHAIGYRMRALDGAPGIVLGFAELRLFRGMPANRSRIEKYVRPLQRGQTRAFGIP